MQASDPSFTPLVGEPARSDQVGEPAGFRPFGDPGPAAPESTPPRAPEAGAVEPSEEVRRAFHAGYQLGRDEQRSQVESVGESFVKALEELAAFRSRLRERYERELLELALGVARKVVQEELAERPGIWLAMIRAAVRRTVDRERIVIRVPGTLLRFLRESLPELRAALDDVRDLELVEDPGLTEGGCVIETRFGDVDIGLETQFAATERALLRAEE